MRSEIASEIIHIRSLDLWLHSWDLLWKDDSVYSCYRYSVTSWSTRFHPGLIRIRRQNSIVDVGKSPYTETWHYLSLIQATLGAHAFPTESPSLPLQPYRCNCCFATWLETGFTRITITRIASSCHYPRQCRISQLNPDSRNSNTNSENPDTKIPDPESRRSISRSWLA